MFYLPFPSPKPISIGVLAGIFGGSNANVFTSFSAWALGERSAATDAADGGGLRSNVPVRSLNVFRITVPFSSGLLPLDCSFIALEDTAWPRLERLKERPSLRRRPTALRSGVFEPEVSRVSGIFLGPPLEFDRWWMGISWGGREWVACGSGRVFSSTEMPEKFGAAVWWFSTFVGLRELLSDECSSGFHSATILVEIADAETESKHSWHWIELIK